MSAFRRTASIAVTAGVIVSGLAFGTSAANAASASISSQGATIAASTLVIDSVDQGTREVRVSGVASPNTAVQVQREQAGRYFTETTARSDVHGRWSAAVEAMGYGTTTFRAWVPGAPTNDGRSYAGATIDRPVTDAELTAKVTQVDRNAKRVSLAGTGMPDTVVRITMGHTSVAAQVSAEGKWIASLSDSSSFDWNRAPMNYLKVDVFSMELGKTVIVRF